MYTLLRWDQRGTRSCNRTGRHVRDIPGDDFYWVVVPERDVFSLRFRDDVLQAPPGRAIVAGREVPCRLHLPHSAAYAPQVPRTEFDHRIRPRGHMRMVLDMRRGLGRIAGDMIRGVHAEQSRLSERDFNAVCDRLTELLCLMVAGETQPQRSHHTEVAEGIRRYLRANLGRTDMRLPAVAHVSSRVHAVKTAGGPAVRCSSAGVWQRPCRISMTRSFGGHGHGRASNPLFSCTVTTATRSA